MTIRQKDRCAEVLETCRTVPPDTPNILKALLAVQSARGYVPTNAIPQIAQVLGVTEAQVSGVLSYYSDLRTQPPGRHLIRVCMGESCMANHGARVFRAIQDYIRMIAGDPTQAARFTVEQMSCAGNCAVAPTVIVDDEVHGRIMPSQMAVLLERYK
jgi:NADH:ubiquinone oxidoreductase subunit E